MGHAPADVWGYTPRQIGGFLMFAASRKRRDAAEKLAIQFNAAHGKAQDINKQIKEMSGS